MYFIINLIQQKNFSYRILTTPNEDMWPGVSELKDYKPTFPKWSDNMLKDNVKNLNSDGVDLLKVYEFNETNFSFFIKCLIIYFFYSKCWFMIQVNELLQEIHFNIIILMI